MLESGILGEEMRNGASQETHCPSKCHESIELTTGLEKEGVVKTPHRESTLR